MKVIRASEIGTYKFCNRAWWYQLQGYKSDNQQQLSKGSEAHSRHYYQVTLAGCLQTFAYVFLLIAILTTLAWLIQSRL